MSLSAREQRDLSAIKDQLADSDHGLVGLLTTFNWLAQGEEMPLRERLSDRDRPPAFRWLHRYRPGQYNRLTAPYRPGQYNRLTALLAGLAVTLLLATLVVVVLVIRGTPDPCPAQWLSPAAASAHGRASCAGVREPRQSSGSARGSQAIVPGE
jgi:hypothetical protein